jgi:16S rRNA (adenine1518-N6/adenine1519-N6)-dimethyltransferase
MQKIKAKKSLGQNFLQDEKTLLTISEFFEISWENILEVGPWYGALTEKIIAKNPKSLDLVELDRDMIKLLQEKVENKNFPLENIDFQIYHQDVLKFFPQKDDYLLIANIPYYITSPILRHFLYMVENKPKKMLILMQKEVAEKILEKWKEKSSVLSLFVAKKSRVEAVISVPRQFFSPVPKVDSVVLAFYYEERLAEIADDIFLNFIKLAFAEPRKKLLNNLAKAGYPKEKLLQILQKFGKDENVRAEDLSLEEYGEMIKGIG